MAGSVRLLGPLADHLTGLAHLEDRAGSVGRQVNWAVGQTSWAEQADLAGVARDQVRAVLGHCRRRRRHRLGTLAGGSLEATCNKPLER